MYTAETNQGGNRSIFFDERDDPRAPSPRRTDIEKVVRQRWKAFSLPEPQRPWHELTKGDLEKMMQTIGVLGGLHGDAMPKGAMVLTPEDAVRAKDQKRVEIANMKHFAFVALAQKFNITVKDGASKEEKAEIAEQILAKMEKM